MGCLYGWGNVAICRSPCGERGLKSDGFGAVSSFSASLPVRGAWIEIYNKKIVVIPHNRRSPCGERGLKFPRRRNSYLGAVVAPRAGSVD